MSDRQCATSEAEDDFHRPEEDMLRASRKGSWGLRCSLSARSTQPFCAQVESTDQTLTGAHGVSALDVRRSAKPTQRCVRQRGMDQKSRGSRSKADLVLVAYDKQYSSGHNRPLNPPWFFQDRQGPPNLPLQSLHQVCEDHRLGCVASDLDLQPPSRSFRSKKMTVRRPKLLCREVRRPSLGEYPLELLQSRSMDEDGLQLVWFRIIGVEEVGNERFFQLENVDEDDSSEVGPGREDWLKGREAEEGRSAGRRVRLADCSKDESRGVELRSEPGEELLKVEDRGVGLLDLDPSQVRKSHA